MSTINKSTVDKSTVNKIYDKICNRGYGRFRKEACKLVASCKLPTKFHQGVTVDMMCFDYYDKENEVIALVHGRPNLPSETPCVRVHSACITGEIFGSEKCDCGFQFDQAMEMICSSSCGIMLYMTSHEGRGIGIRNKIMAYQLQERGANTLEANEILGLPLDGRDFKPAAEVLKFFNIEEIKLITNNPEKRLCMEKNGIKVIEQLPITTNLNKHNRNYLLLKQNVLNHNFGVVLN